VANDETNSTTLLPAHDQAQPQSGMVNSINNPFLEAQISALIGQQKLPDYQDSKTGYWGERPDYWQDLPALEQGQSPKDRTVSVLAPHFGLLPYIRAGIEAQNRGEAFWGGSPQYDRQLDALRRYYATAYEGAPDAVKVLAFGGGVGALTKAATVPLTSPNVPTLRDLQDLLWPQTESGYNAQNSAAFAARLKALVPNRDGPNEPIKAPEPIDPIKERLRGYYIRRADSEK
jgi:hypothetical protein